MTFPNDPDTDDDGLDDGVETDTGMWNGPTDTGTSPIDPDEDDDLLLDGAETNDGSNDSLTDTGSDPYEADTAGDLIPDYGEVMHGFDPNDDTSTPPDVMVLFIGGGADGGLSFADPAFRNFLEQYFGPGNVDYVQASASVAGDETGYDLLVLSATPTSGDIRFKFQNSTVGIANWEEARPTSRRPPRVVACTCR